MIMRRHWERLEQRRLLSAGGLDAGIDELHGVEGTA